MKRFGAGLGLLLMLMANQGSSDLFLHDMETIADAYYDLGGDNNYLDMKLTNIEKYDPQQQANMVSLNFDNLENLAIIIKECVFMGKGSRGDHLDPLLQERISLVFARTIYIKADGSATPINVFVNQNQEVKMSTGIFGAPCVFGFEYDGQILLMQGAAID